MAPAQASPSHSAHAPLHPRDPLAWCAALTGLFALLAGWRLAIPSIAYFDEVHYLPAAREILSLFTVQTFANMVHGKRAGRHV